jgi:hypothetical protein
MFAKGVEPSADGCCHPPQSVIQFGMTASVVVGASDVERRLNAR